MRKPKGLDHGLSRVRQRDQHENKAAAGPCPKGEVPRIRTRSDGVSQNQSTYEKTMHMSGARIECPKTYREVDHEECKLNSVKTLERRQGLLEEEEANLSSASVSIPPTDRLASTWMGISKFHERWAFFGTLYGYTRQHIPDTLCAGRD